MTSYTPIPSDTKTLIDNFKRWDSIGWSYFPLPYKSKKPVIEWAQYQHRRPTEAEKQSWLADETPRNWALVLGSISSANGGCLVALDFDELTSFEKWRPIAEDKLAISRLLDITPIAETSRGLHILFDVAEPVSTQKFPSVEVRSEGAYILIAPSVHPYGKPYEWLNPDINPFAILSLTDVGIEVNQRKPVMTIEDNWITEALQGVPEGERDATCTRLAGYFVKSNPPDVAKIILYPFADRCNPPLPHFIVDKCVDSINEKERTIRGDNNPLIGDNSRMYIPYTPPCHADLNINRDKSVTDSVTEPLKDRIHNFLKLSTGWITHEAIDRDLNLDPRERVNRRQAIHRLIEDGVLESHPTDDKQVRFINTDVRKIDFKVATKRTPLELEFPFGMERFFNLYPKNIIVVAGSPNSGKTAWLLNVIRVNMAKYPIFYQSSEMEGTELVERLSLFPDIEVEDWNFEAEYPLKDHADVIRPDCINIIDYMILTENIYLVADKLDAIHQKLGSGIAIVAIQKKIGAKLGRGQEFGLERPRLYVSMDVGKMELLKVKNPKNPEHDSNGYKMKFSITHGCRFTPDAMGWYKGVD